MQVEVQDLCQTPCTTLAPATLAPVTEGLIVKVYVDLLRHLIISALLITGGSGSVGNSVEVFIPSTGQHCHLPDIPGEERYYHTMEKFTICGGYSTSKSCLTLTDGTWETSTTLQQWR